MVLFVLERQMIHQMKNGNFVWGYQLYRKIRKAMQNTKFSEAEQAKILNLISKRLELEIRQSLININNWPLIANMTALYFEIAEETNNLYKISERGLEIVRALTRTKMAKSQELAEFMDTMVEILIDSQNYRLAIESLFASVIFKVKIKRDRLVTSLSRILEMFLEKISPDDGTLIIYCVLLNAFRMIMPESIRGEEFQRQLINFTSTVYKLMGDLLDNLGREALSRVNIMFKRNQDVFANQQFIENLLLKLFLLKEYDWTFTLFYSYYEYLVEHKVNKPALIEYINIYIDRAVKFGGLRVAFDTYLLLSNLIDNNQTQFQIEKANLWAETSELYRSYSDKHLFVACIDYLRDAILKPVSIEDVQTYLSFKNKLFAFQIEIVEVSLDDILYALLYRAIYEVKSYNLAIYIRSLITKLITTEDSEFSTQFKESKTLSSSQFKMSMMMLEEKSPEFFNILDGIIESLKCETEKIVPPQNSYDVIRSMMQLHEKSISIETVLGSFDSPSMNSNVVIEEPIPISILIKYQQLFADEFSKILYLLLPLNLRNYLNVMHSSKNALHEIMVVCNSPICFPLEYIEDHSGFFISKYCFGYHFGRFYEYPRFYFPNSENPKHKSILLIGTLNEQIPTVFNHKTKIEEPALKNQELTNIFRTLQIQLKGVSSNMDIDVINFTNGSLNEIIQKIESKNYSIIHFMNPIIYSEISPLQSYFITSDFQNLTLKQIQNAIEKQIAIQASQNEKITYPLLILDTALALHKIKDSHEYKQKIFRIASKLKNSNFSGIVGRIEPNYTIDSLNILTEFYRACLNGANFGQSLNYAWNKANVSNLYYLLFGIPWKSL